MGEYFASSMCTSEARLKKGAQRDVSYFSLPPDKVRRNAQERNIGIIYIDWIES